MSASAETISTARNLMMAKDHGVFSSLSKKFDGMPFGSVMTYCTDQQGYPVALFSTIAQHTANINADSRCSLTILEGKGHDPQAEGRLTIGGNLVKLEDISQIEDRFYCYFPKAKAYKEFHDFDFYVLEPTFVRYIGGFGKIHWIDSKEFFIANPFEAKAEQGMISHMNEHHAASIRDYFKHLKGVSLAENQEVSMCGVDREGFDVLVDGVRHRFETAEMSDAMTARKVLTDMAHAAKS
jgi:putative heme iron utilization protein